MWPHQYSFCDTYSPCIPYISPFILLINFLCIVYPFKFRQPCPWRVYQLKFLITFILCNYFPFYHVHFDPDWIFFILSLCFNYFHQLFLVTPFYFNKFQPFISPAYFILYVSYLKWLWYSLILWVNVSPLQYVLLQSIPYLMLSSSHLNLCQICESFPPRFNMSDNIPH